MDLIRCVAYVVTLLSIVACDDGSGGGERISSAAETSNETEQPQLNQDVKSGIWFLQETLNGNKLGSKIPYVIIASEGDFTLKKCGKLSEYFYLDDGVYINGIPESYTSTPTLKKATINTLTGTLNGIKWEFTHYKDRTYFGLGEVSIRGEAFGEQHALESVCGYVRYPLDTDDVPDPGYNDDLTIGMTVYGDIDLTIHSTVGSINDNGTDQSLRTHLQVSDIEALGGKRFGGIHGWSTFNKDGYFLTPKGSRTEFSASFLLTEGSDSSYTLSGELFVHIFY